MSYTKQTFLMTTFWICQHIIQKMTKFSFSRIYFINIYTSNLRKLAFQKIYLVVYRGHGGRGTELVLLYKNRTADSALVKWTFPS